MRSGMKRERAALAVIEQALNKALLQLTLAQSAAGLCGEPLSHELDDLVAHATELRHRIADATCLGTSTTSDRSTTPFSTLRDATTSAR
jgi:hypothetical protein